MPDSHSDPFFFRPHTERSTFCSFVQLELCMSKTYWIRQNLVQNKTDVHTKDPPLAILVFLTCFFFRHYETFFRKFFDFFQFAFIGAPRLLLQTKRFASIEDCLRFSALCDIFRKKNFRKMFFSS